MAQFNIDIDVNYKSVEDLQKELRSLESEFSTLAIGSDGFTELGNKIKGIKSELKDVELQFEGLDKEQRATALVDTFNGLTGAVGAASSAFLAFGASSEEIENVEKKLLGVIGVVSGLRDVSNATVAATKLYGPAFSNLGKSISTAFSSGTKAVNAFKLSLASIGIGALIIGITLLIENWDELSESLGFATAEQKAFTATEKEATTAGLDQVLALNSLENSLNNTNLSLDAKQEAYKELQKSVPALTDFTYEEALANGVLTKSIDLQRQAIIARAKAEVFAKAAAEEARKQIEIQNKTVEESVGFFEKSFNTIISGVGPGGAALAGVKNLGSAIKNNYEETEKSAGLQAKFQAEAEVFTNKALELEAEINKTRTKGKEIKEKNTEASKNQTKAEQDAIKKAEELEKLRIEIEEARQIRLAEGFEKERIAIEQSYADRVKLLVDAGQQETAAYKELIAQRDAAILEARTKFDADVAAKEQERIDKATAIAKENLDNDIKALDEEFTAKQNVLSEQFLQQVITQEEYDNQLEQLEIQRIERQIELARAAGISVVDLEEQLLNAKIAIRNKDVANVQTTEQAKLTAQLGYLNAASAGLSALSGLFEEGSKASKAAALAEIAIGTGTGFIQGLDIAQKSAAAGGPAAVGLFPIFYATQIAAVLSAASQAKKILQTVPGGGTSPTPAPPTIPAAAGSPVTGQTGGLLPTQGNEFGLFGAPTSGVGINNQPIIKTYVLAGDVSAAQAVNEKIAQRRKL